MPFEPSSVKCIRLRGWSHICLPLRR